MKIICKIILIILLTLSISSLLVYSQNDSEYRKKTINDYITFNIDLVINGSKIINEYPILEVNEQVMVPIKSLFSSLGAQIYYYEDSNILTSYRLNTYVKLDINENMYYINGKEHFYDEYVTLNNILYVPLNLLIESFDFNIIEYVKNEYISLSANTLIQYKNYDEIPYQQISSANDGIRYSVPIYWDKIDDNFYGYNKVNNLKFTTMTLNENIDIKTIVDIYKEDLYVTYEDNISIDEQKQNFYTYLTSNVLYLTLDVNENIIKRVVHFIKGEDLVYIITFNYSTSSSEEFMLDVFDTIMNSFYIDKSSVDIDSEHYIEYTTANDYGLFLSGNIYSNMTMYKSFILEGYFNTKENIESLTITVSKNSNELEFYVPVENNSFKANIYTPFGLGKHNLKIEISKTEEKVIFDPNNDDKNANDNIEDRLLIQFSVVNLSDEAIRYTIPTKYVQSNDPALSSMSEYVSNKFSTNYSKAKSIYDYIIEKIDLIPFNEEVYSARDVYDNFKGTKLEISLYLVSLLRAQNIPARIVEGRTEFSIHHWTEAYLNGKWIIIDPFGSSEIYNNDFKQYKIEPSFNGNKLKYSNWFNEHIILQY